MIAWHARQNACIGGQAVQKASAAYACWTMPQDIARHGVSVQVATDEHILGSVGIGMDQVRRARVKGHEPSVGRDRWVVAGVVSLGSGLG